MGFALALPAIASLALTAAVEPVLTLRTEGRGTRYTSGGDDTYRAAVSTIPQASVTVDGPPFRVETSYAATLWTSDVAARQDPLVSHALDARIDLVPDAPWRATASAGLLRGDTDPLASTPGATNAGASQLASTGPIPYQSLRGGLHLERLLDADQRWTVSGDGRFGETRVLHGGLTAVLPTQRSAGGNASLSHRVTERDTIAARTSGDWSETGSGGARTTALSGSVDASWRRALTPTLDGWASAGVGYLRSDEPATTRRDLLPVGGVGVTRRAPRGGVGIDLQANVTSAVDRFRGDVRQAADARLTLSWAPVDPLTLSAQAAGARRVDGETTLGSANLGVAWAVRPWVALEGGALWRRQRERRPDVPSFTETGAFMGLRIAAGRR